MKLGIISDLRNPQHPRFHRPWVQHYHEFLDFIVQLEDLGFEEVVFPEHHFEPDGYISNPIPIPTVSLGATYVVAYTYGPDGGRISPTRCAVIGAGRGDR